MKNIRITDRFFAVMVVLYLVITLSVTTQEYLLKRERLPGETHLFTKYNNFVIFQRSFYHLVEGKNLYVPYRNEQIDLYKYSPTFALMFGVLAWMPDWLGLGLWNLMNTLALICGIWLLPVPTLKKKGLILLLALLDMLISLQNSQSNVLVAGLLICGFGLLEKKRYFTAMLCILMTFYIKIFGIAALLLVFLYPEKWKILKNAVLAFLVLGILPLPLMGTGRFITAYLQYFDLLKMDQSVSYGLSVMGVLKSWFNLDAPKTLVLLAGTILLLLPLIKRKEFSHYRFRLMFLASVLVWIIIFNHKAESPAFIIATSGIYIMVLSFRPGVAGNVFAVLVFLFTSLSASDIFPVSLRDGFFVPYTIKVVPCILMWGRILFGLLAFRPGEGESDCISDPGCRFTWERSG